MLKHREKIMKQVTDAETALNDLCTEIRAIRYKAELPNTVAGKLLRETVHPD
jgi:hypothetical protein